MRVRFLQLDERAVLPTFSHNGDGCADLTAIDYRFDPVTQTHVYDFGFAVEIPDGYVGLIFMRSSVYKTGLSLNNAVGVLDSSYRGPVSARFRLFENEQKEIYKVGDRVAQLMIIPYVTFVPMWSQELSTTGRGKAGWGSSGK